MSLTEGGIETIKIAPPAIVTAGTVLFGLSLEQWVASLTLLYLVMIIGERATKWVFAWRRDRRRRA